MSGILKKSLRYKKPVLFAVMLLTCFRCCGYICRWENDTKSGYRFISEFGNGKSKKIGMAVISDCKYFPVIRNNKAEYYYENGYGGMRTYGGNRSHEGIDIMSSCDKAKIFKIRSVSDGIVEKKGWLKLGGYRIGIRSGNGNYYYYAHLAAYRENLECGDKVKAGEVIGYMGSTGYGKEGTSGKFPVHLHFGVYIKNKTGEESVNPYYLLKKLEN